MEIKNNEHRGMQVLLVLYILKKCPEKLAFNPKVFCVDEKNVGFGMHKHYGRLWLSKSSISNALICLN